MKLPSFLSLWRGLLHIAGRFPLQFIITILATITACWLIELPYDRYVLINSLLKFLVLCNIGFALLLAGDLFAETNGIDIVKKSLLRLAILIFCTAGYLVLDPKLYDAHAYKLILLIIAAHLLVSFSAFLRSGSTNGFWQFNKTLFLRFATAVLYTAVLSIGLAIALFAVNNLFSLHLRDRFYQHIFVIVGLGFNSLFFLAGIPNRVSYLEKQTDYPKGLKIFTQYVLIPLMSIYLLILLLYEVKIALSWELPKGLVSSLIIGYAFFGILSLLLIYPIRNTAGNRWVMLFSRFFYWMMVPLLVLLVLAIYKRVGHYGITEPRYFLVSLALWLSFVAIYFLISKKQNIKIIPISLCIIVLLAIYGPQSAFTIAKTSQIARLKRLAGRTDESSVYEKTSIVRYLVKHHGLTSLQSFTNSNLQTIENTFHKKENLESAYTIVNKKIDTAFTLLSIDPDKASLQNNSYNVSIPHEQVTEVNGWDYLIVLDNYQKEVHAPIGQDSLTLRIDDDGRSCWVSIGEDQHLFKLDGVIKEIDLARKNNTLPAKHGFGNNFYYPAEKMQLSAQIKDYTVKLSIISLYVNKYRSENTQEYAVTFKANLLLKKVSPQ